MYMRTAKHLHAGIIAALLVAGVGLGASPGAAATQVLQERVRISDLDLSTARGELVFERRVHAAVNRVCGTPASAAVNRRRVAQRECRRKAWEGVRLQLSRHGLPAERLLTRN